MFRKPSKKRRFSNYPAHYEAYLRSITRLSTSFTAIFFGFSLYCVNVCLATSYRETVQYISDFAGFYAYVRVVPKSTEWSALGLAAAKNEEIDGVSILLYWKDVEPHQGHYDWNALDELLFIDIQGHKKIAIGVEAGGNTPDWIYFPQEKGGVGVNAVTFSPYDINPPDGKCETLREPAFWEPSFVDAYLVMIKSLSEHLKSKFEGLPYKNLRLVKVAGIGLETEELRVDAHPPGGKCYWGDGTEGLEPNAASLWAAAGYRPKLVLGAWDKLQTGLANIFPDKILNVAIIPKNAFPPISDDGDVDDVANSKPPETDLMTELLLKQSISMYHNKLLVQWNALSQLKNSQTGAWKVPRQVMLAKQKGAYVGWQLNNALGIHTGAACIYPPFVRLPCKNLDDYVDIFRAGEESGGIFFEIHSADLAPKFRQMPRSGGLENYIPAIKTAHENFWRRRLTK